MLSNSPKLLACYTKNSAADKAKFDAKFRAPLSATDGVGFVYGFYPKEQIDDEGTWIKLGRTAKWDPNERVKEWDGEIVFCVKTFANKKLERLVHLLFSYANVIIFNSETNAREIEWFCFKEKTNIATLVSMLNDTLVDFHNIPTTFIAQLTSPPTTRPVRVPVASQITTLATEHTGVPVVAHPVLTLIARSVTGPIVTPISRFTNLATNKIDLNTATAEQLQTIYGIGPVLSNRIVEDRKINGPYTSVEQVERVKGIGPVKCNSIAEMTTVIKRSCNKPMQVKNINLNTACVQQLQQIAGIGPVLSQRIVDDRKINGLYTNVEQIQRVHMIGPGRYKNISKMCYV